MQEGSISHMGESGTRKRKVVITGVAGLVGQNLVARLADREDLELVGLDKHRHNLALLRRHAPHVDAIWADLGKPGEWRRALDGANTLVLLHAQITGKGWAPFERNTVRATELVLECARRASVDFIVHVSSSVVNSRANDDYTRSKVAQERLVRGSGIPHCILRPTLMYGWFDSKHLGWLARFMEKTPVFPVPGHGRYPRQPLFVGDFCRVIEVCLERRPVDAVYDLVGHEHIDFVDILRTIRRIKGLKTPLVHVPIPIFAGLLRVYALGSSRPPFTADQLAALTAGDDFTGVDLLETFGVEPTCFEDGATLTLTDPRFAGVTLEKYV